MRLFHVVARAYRHDTPLCEAPIAPTLWCGLRRAFPGALAAALMPSHSHVITPADSAQDAVHRMGAVVSGVRRSVAGRAIRWEPIPVPHEVSDAKHLMRHLRYVWLNPARDGLVRDPLAWLWSSYRDLIGAVVDPWIPPNRVARALGQRQSGLTRRLHAYVSADPSVNVMGTDYPEEAGPSPIPGVSLARIRAAACVVHRAPPYAIARRTQARATFLDLARACGWRDVATLRAAACVSSNAVWNRARIEADVPAAAWLCLGDRRLTAPISEEGW